MPIASQHPAITWTPAKCQTVKKEISPLSLIRFPRGPSFRLVALGFGEATIPEKMPVTGETSDAAEIPLLDDVVDGVLDYKGRPVARSKFGGWRSASFIIGIVNAQKRNQNYKFYNCC